MRVLELPAGKSYREWGRIHGESFRAEIRVLADIRTYLCMKVGAFRSRDAVLEAARAHLPVLERYHAGLHAELCGIAEGAGVTPADIVIANHYTDLRDLDPDPKTWKPAPIGDGCSMIFAETPTGRILAQTWDMHATAMPYVMLLSVPESADGPAAKLLTVTGCLGMCGMSGQRVAIAINNLFSTDATLGVVWPAMVRRALLEPAARAAARGIERSPIGSGHHYFVVDATSAFSIEASGTRRVLRERGDEAFVHTNHCLDGEIAAVSKVPETSTTYARLQWLETDLRRAPIRDLADAWQRLGDGVNEMRATPENPHLAATCGAIAMNLTTGELWAQQGLIHNVAADSWQV